MRAFILIAAIHGFFAMAAPVSASGKSTPLLIKNYNHHLYSTDSELTTRHVNFQRTDATFNPETDEMPVDPSVGFEKRENDE